MKKKLIAAVVALSVILALAVALLIYLEWNQDFDGFGHTSPSVSSDGETEPTSTTEPTETDGKEAALPEPTETTDDGAEKTQPTEPQEPTVNVTEAPESTVDVTEAPEPTNTETVPVEDMDGEFIIGPEDTVTEETDPERETDSTEYTPPDGLDEDETPIL